MRRFPKIIDETLNDFWEISQFFEKTKIPNILRDVQFHVLNIVYI